MLTSSSFSDGIITLHSSFVGGFLEAFFCLHCFFDSHGIILSDIMSHLLSDDKIQNEVIRSKTKVKVVIERVRCMRGQWEGYVARMSNTGWAKITSEWTPREGKQVTGRPKGDGETTVRKLVAVNG